MIRKLVITERAHDDIERNAVWWALNHSVAQAVSWQATVYQQLEDMVLMPESIPLAPETERIGEPLRQRTVGLGRGGYGAVFRITDDGVQVLTIRRGAQADLEPQDLK
jgi:plasmid stabilization system protein ParE